jgi:hypothetical protein
MKGVNGTGSVAAGTTIVHKTSELIHIKTSGFM